MDNNSEKTYFNRSACSGAERGTVGAGNHKVLKLRFATYDAAEKTHTNKFYTMFLTKENNDQNREVLQALGCEPVPAVVNFEAVGDLKGIGTRTVDLVETTNEAGYKNIKFINEPKFGTRVFDMRTETKASSPDDTTPF